MRNFIEFSLIGSGLSSGATSIELKPLKKSDTQNKKM